MDKNKDKSKSQYKGILGNMFDYDHDGGLNWYEKGAELAFLAMAHDELSREARANNELDDCRFSDDYFDDDEYPYDESGETSFEDDLEEFDGALDAGMGEVSQCDCDSPAGSNVEKYKGSDTSCKKRIKVHIAETAPPVPSLSQDNQTDESSKEEIHDNAKLKKCLIVAFCALLVLSAVIFSVKVVSVKVEQNRVCDFVLNTVRRYADSYKLQVEKVEVEKSEDRYNSYDAYYYIPNFDEISYSKMCDFVAVDAVYRCNYVYDYTIKRSVKLKYIYSGEDIYEVNPWGRTVEKNGEIVFKDKTKDSNERSWSTSSGPRTPYEGMYVDPYDPPSGWSDCGKDSYTFTYKTEKFTCTKNNVKYTVWVSYNTYKVVKIKSELQDNSYSTKSSNTKKPTVYYDYDEYDVGNYSNAEDFYDDNYDNFFDYYDAEDYYNEHGG